MIEALAEAFYSHRNPGKSEEMSAYMKGQFVYLGISKPERALLQKNYIHSIRKNKKINWEDIRSLWNLPEREFQYAALDTLLALNKTLQKGDMEQIQYLIESKSWWDTVDLLASNSVGHLCSRYPELIHDKILKWADSANLWLIRSAILFQLKYKEKTDAALLERIILRNKNTKEFFINKAIGWALREYSKIDPHWVTSFISAHPLHPLSVREGSKYL